MRTTKASAECWKCGTVVPVARLAVETMIHSRRQQDGGPYRSFRCSACGTTNGALQNRRGAWLLYPLEGSDEPSLIDWISPRFSRESLRAAVEWWARHRMRVIRFRQDAASADGAVRAPRHDPPPGRKRARTRQAPPPPRTEQPPPPEPPPPPPPPPQPPPPPEPPTTSDPATRAPRELLGIDAGASADDVKRAYRRALKLCHPDRVANLDPEIQALAHRKAKALRRAYESLLRELGD